MLFHQVLAESDRSRKALEFQLKMKTLEIEAALDTAEETRKKIVELTSEKQKVNRLLTLCYFHPVSKELDDQIVNRLMHKHNIKPSEEQVLLVLLYLISKHVVKG